MGNYDRDHWLKENAPDLGTYNADAVKAFMKFAYDAGRKQAEQDAASRAASEERERRYGPDL